MKEITIEGKGGSIVYDDKKIIIKRKGFMAFAAHGIKGDKTIPIKNITSLQFKETIKFGRGYIQFSIMGGREAKGGMFQGIYDENTVQFTYRQQSDFKKMKEYIEEKIY